MGNVRDALKSNTTCTSLLSCDSAYYGCNLHWQLETGLPVYSMHHEYNLDEEDIKTNYYHNEGTFHLKNGLIHTTFVDGGYYSHKPWYHDSDLNRVYERKCDCGKTFYY